MDFSVLSCFCLMCSWTAARRTAVKAWEQVSGCSRTLVSGSDIQEKLIQTVNQDTQLDSTWGFGNSMSKAE